MATYLSIKGCKVQVLASDPSPLIEGMVWFNSTTNVIKFYNGSSTLTVTVS